MTTERVAKFLSSAGYCSRRDAERLIAEGRVSVNGATLETPATLVGASDVVRVDGKRINGNHLDSMARLFLYSIHGAPNSNCR